MTTDSSIEQPFVPRANLQRALKYRPHLKWMFYSINAVAILLIILITYLAASRLLESDWIWAAGVFFGLGLLPALLIFQNYYVVRPMAFTKVHLMPDRIILDQLSGNSEILFSEIASVEMRHIPYSGGWFSLIMKNGHKHKFNNLLERSEYILEAVATSQPQLLSLDQYLPYRRTAVTVDHSWARMYGKLKNWKILLIKFLLVPLVLTGLLAASGMLRASAEGSSAAQTFAEQLVVVTLLNFVLGYVVGIISDVIVMAKFRADLKLNPNTVIRNLAHEKKLNLYATVVHAVLLLVGVALLTFIL